MKYKNNRFTLDIKRDRDSLLYFCDIFSADILKLCRELKFNGFSYWDLKYPGGNPLRTRLSKCNEFEKWDSLYTDYYLTPDEGDDLWICDVECQPLVGKKLERVFETAKWYASLRFSGIKSLETLKMVHFGEDTAMTGIVALGFGDFTVKLIVSLDVETTEIRYVAPMPSSLILYLRRYTHINGDDIRYIKGLGVTPELLMAESALNMLGGPS